MILASAELNLWSCKVEDGFVKMHFEEDSEDFGAALREINKQKKPRGTYSIPCILKIDNSNTT